MLHVLGASLPPHTNPLQFTDRTGRISATATKVRRAFGQTQVVSMRRACQPWRHRQAQSLVAHHPWRCPWNVCRTHIKVQVVPSIGARMYQDQPTVCEKLEGWRGSAFPRPLLDAGRRSVTFSAGVWPPASSRHFFAGLADVAGSQDRPTPGFLHRNWQRRMAWPK